MLARIHILNMTKYKKKLSMMKLVLTVSCLQKARHIQRIQLQAGIKRQLILMQGQIFFFPLAMGRSAARISQGTRSNSMLWEMIVASPSERRILQQQNMVLVLASLIKLEPKEKSMINTAIQKYKPHRKKHQMCCAHQPVHKTKDLN